MRVVSLAVLAFSFTTPIHTVVPKPTETETVVATPAPAPVPVIVKVEQPKPDPKEEAPAQKWRYREWSVFVFGVLTLGVNGALAYVGWRGIQTANRTLKQIEKQNGISEKTLILQFRPRLKIYALNVEVESKISSSLQVFFVNAGDTPAHVESGALHLSYRNAINEKASQQLCFEKQSISPGETVKIGFKANEKMSTGLFGATYLPVNSYGRSNGHCVLLGGMVLYRDDIGTRREVTVIKEYDAEKGLFKTPSLIDGENLHES